MNDALPMRTFESTGDLHGISECFFIRQRAGAQTLGQRLALEVLHDQKFVAVVSSNVIQTADVRMIERGNRPRLAMKTLLHVFVRGKLRGQQLDRYVASEA